MSKVSFIISANEEALVYGKDLFWRWRRDFDSRILEWEIFEIFVYPK